jgi:hypothetical protein
MSKKPNLAKALNEAAGAQGAGPARLTSTPSEHATPKAAAIPRPPSREGKRAIAGHFDPAVSRQLRYLALENDTSVQALLREALNDLFRKYGKSSIA